MPKQILTKIFLSPKGKSIIHLGPGGTTRAQHRLAGKGQVYVQASRCPPIDSQAYIYTLVASQNKNPAVGQQFTRCHIRLKCIPGAPVTIYKILLFDIYCCIFFIYLCSNMAQRQITDHMFWTFLASMNMLQCTVCSPNYLICKVIKCSELITPTVQF